MGVTLERVQNKFACIIGELCSEPVVLSQFAIWLDLRLAEYKAKGAISLDCSGDEPDPSWLKGHAPPPARSKSRETILARPIPSPHRNNFPHQQRNISHSQSVPSTNLPCASERLSPDVVVVKREQSDSRGDIFPVSLHLHDNASPSLRKRTVSQTDNSNARQSSPSLVSSSPKVRRVESSSDGGTPPVTLEAVHMPNQSLMSIISGDSQEHGLESDNLTEEIMPDYSIQDQQLHGDSSAFQSHQIASTSSSANESFGEMGGEILGLDTSNSAVPDVPGGGEYPLDMTVQTTAASAATCPQEMMYPPILNVQKLSLPRPGFYTATKVLHTKFIKSRIVDIHSKSQTTIGNIVGAVGKLENWLTSTHRDNRCIEIIPPLELDVYLVEFFGILKNRHGSDYDPESYSNFRSFVERFLKELSYPASLSSSVEFSNSQIAFKTRRKALLEAATERRKMKYRHDQLKRQILEAAELAAAMNQYTS